MTSTVKPHEQVSSRYIYRRLQLETSPSQVVQLLRQKYSRRLRGISREMDQKAAAGQPAPRCYASALKTLELLTEKSLEEEASRICDANRLRIHLQRKKDELSRRPPRTAVQAAFKQAL